MILNTKARYAVMAMVDLAGREPEKPVCLADLAESQEMTVPYLEQIFHGLKQAGLVRSVRGPGGGYTLAREAGAITIADIVAATEESLKVTRCQNHGKQQGGCMSGKAKCLTHDLWEGLENKISDYLQSVTIAHVRNRELPGLFTGN